REKTICLAGNGIGFVEKSLRAGHFPGQHRRRAGETAHRQNSDGLSPAKNFSRSQKGFSKTFAKRKIISVLQTDGGQRKNLHAVRGFHGLLVNVLGRDE